MNNKTLIDTEAPIGVRQRAVEASRDETQPVVYWAMIGGAITLFWLWIMFKWISGPYFTPTLPGPTEQPDWMYTAQYIFQGVSMGLIFIVGYYFWWKPWRDERRVTTDGALAIAFLTLYFQDQISNAGGYWFTYNAHVFNMGSWFPEVPGWLTFAAPGHTPGEPILMMASGYIYFFLIMMFAGLAIFRKLREVFPRLSTPVLFFIVFLCCGVLDAVIEIGIWMPMGFYAYTDGGIFPMINAGSPLQFPLVEAIGVGFVSMTIVAYRYYTDDKGQTLCERGLDKINTTPAKKAVLRVFALIAAMQLLFFFSYNVPMYMVGAHSSDWIDAHMERSYYMNGICGSGTDRACPTSDMPKVIKSDNPISVNPDGKLVVPEKSKKPDNVPFLDKPKGPW